MWPLLLICHVPEELERRAQTRYSQQSTHLSSLSAVPLSVSVCLTLSLSFSPTKTSISSSSNCHSQRTPFLLPPSSPHLPRASDETQEQFQLHIKGVFRSTLGLHSETLRRGTVLHQALWCERDIDHSRISEFSVVTEGWHWPLVVVQFWLRSNAYRTRQSLDLYSYFGDRLATPMEDESRLLKRRWSHTATCLMAASQASSTESWSPSLWGAPACRLD